MPEPVLTLLTATAAKEALKKSIGDLYDLAKAATKRELAKWHADKNITKAFGKFLAVRQVKTLWQVDKAVDLTSFYCPSRIEYKTKRAEVASLDDLSPFGNVLIEGIAGQGKSILLRYLSAVETARKGKIPIFIELRQIQRGETISDHVKQFLSDIGVECDKELFEWLIGSGKIVLLLDAFDELDGGLVKGAIKEIEHLIAKHQALKIVVTSRPNSALKMSANFWVVQLSDLRDNEYEQVVRKLLDAPDAAKQLIGRVRSHGNQIVGLLITPLAVTLLVLTYKSYQEVPTQMSEFYENLFQLLLQRHDGSKPGYSRKRRCKELNDAAYRKLFDGFCYFSKQLKPQEMVSSKINETAERAFKDAGVKGNAEDFIRDIVEITCLLLEEGGEYRFIHKSVQEFYAASFLRRKPDKVVRKVYAEIIKPALIHDWQNEVNFLREIDLYRVSKFAVLPELLKTLGINESALQVTELPASSIEAVKRWLGQLRWTFSETGEVFSAGGLILSSVPGSVITDEIPGVWNRIRIHLDDFADKRIEKVGLGPSKRGYAGSWSEIASRSSEQAKILETVATIIAKKLFKEARVVLRQIEREEGEELLEAVFNL